MNEAGQRRMIAAALFLLPAGWIAVRAARAVTEHRTRPAAPSASLAIPLPLPAPLPGPAAVPATPPAAAPATGVTGTTALPPLPRYATLLPEPAGIVPARPFRAAGTARDRGRAMECLTAAIYYEAASESDAGQRAVAQVVLNRARHPAFPPTVCGVVYQGSERSGCQFSFACDGAMGRAPSVAQWARAARVAAGALAGGVYAPVGLATHYHSFAVRPPWSRTLVMTDAVGAHFFHRWRGWWGTAAAFTQAYRGAEPVPGPHARAGPAALSTPPPRAGDRLPPAPPTPAPPAASATSGGDTLPPAPQVLDRWRESGRPIR